MKRFEVHSHSHFSNLRLLDSINRPKDMLKTAEKLGLSGLTITDHEALCSHVDFLQLEEQLKKKGELSEDFTLALGNELYLIDTRNKEEILRHFHFILIAKNNTGHLALRELSSQAWYNSFYDRGLERVPTLKSELEAIVDKYPNSLIGTSACLGGEINYWFTRHNESRDLEEREFFKQKIINFLTYCNDLFGEDFYLEIAPSHNSDQIKYNKMLLTLAEKYNIKVVIGTDAHYLTEKDRPIHKAYLNSKNGEREVDDFYASAHLMSYEEIREYFTYIPDSILDQIIENSEEIRNKIEGYSLNKDSIIPLEQVQDYPKQNLYKDYEFINKLLNSDNVQDRYWINQCLEGLKEKQLENPVYLDRLNIEADVIVFIGERLNQPLTGYFNTLQFYINLFWECGSIVGPGRGSAVGFLSNYLLGITQLDPIRWELPYFRFLNKERVEMSDIDIDLAPSKRALIFKKIREHRGELNLLQVCTFGTEQTRSAILAAARGYRSVDYPEGLDVDIAQYLSGMIPSERGFLWPLNDCVNGNEEKDRRPIRSFVEEVEKYPGLLDIMLGIEGLVNKRSQHASGVVLYQNNPWETNAIMRSPGGELITQFALHQSEWLGDIKYDFLVTEVSDKIIACINLLQKDRYFSDLSLRDIYNKYIHPEVIDLKNEDIWNALANGSVIDVFQFNSDVGLQAAKQVKPSNPIEMSDANALMRLMAEKGHERPMDRYIRMKNNIEDWYNEVRRVGLDEEDIKILEKYYLPRHGTPCMQEDLMLIVMDEKISKFTLKESNDCRKIVGKKEMARIPELKEKFFNACPNKILAAYVWETNILPQLGYSFSSLHSLAYSFVGIQTLFLATSYPQVYWNCACLIVNSGGDLEEELEDIDDIEDEDIEEEEVEEKKKVKNKTTAYGKIATAIGTMRSAGIMVSPPDINNSNFSFSPDIESNSIRYGLKGINRIGNSLVKQIIATRPYTSIDDFLNKIKISKPQMVNLVKSGAFDKLIGDRFSSMNLYIRSISDQKKKLTLQNVQMLIGFDLLPKELEFEKKVFNFNKYIRKQKTQDSFVIDEVAMKFYSEWFDMGQLMSVSPDGKSAEIDQKIWDKIYKKYMAVVKKYITDNHDELLNKLNDLLMKEMWDKYCLGGLPKWEMDSISFYSNEHELEELDEREFEIINFFDLPDEPVVDRVVLIKGREVPLYKLVGIAGTVLDKNKTKNTVSLLTKYGVVNIKIWQAQYVLYDRQISRKQADGTKKIIERSWLSRGNKLIIYGIRRGDTFVPKVYKNSKWERPIALITGMDEYGYPELRFERANSE